MCVRGKGRGSGGGGGGESYYENGLSCVKTTHNKLVTSLVVPLVRTHTEREDMSIFSVCL